MDFSDFIPIIAAKLGIAAPTLVFLIFAVVQGAKVVGRLIPNDATGVWAVLRNFCTIIGVDPSSRVTTGVTVQDVSAAALKTPPIPDTPPVSDKINEEK